MYMLRPKRLNFSYAWAHLFYCRKAFCQGYWQTILRQGVGVQALNWSKDQYILVRQYTEPVNQCNSIVPLGRPEYARYNEVSLPSIQFLNASSGKTFLLDFSEIDFRVKRKFSW